MPRRFFFASSFFLPLAFFWLAGLAPATRAAPQSAATDKSANAKSCVWKVTTPDGQRTLYLAGSVHALRSSDYPLPKSYDLAFANCTRLAFEVDPDDMGRMRERLMKAATLPNGTQVRDRVDPRTYVYLQRVLAKTKTPESKIASYQPWYLAMRLESPGGPLGASSSWGIETYLAKKAAAAKKPIDGLESWRSPADVFAAMSPEDAEATLLLTFIQLDNARAEFLKSLTAWRQGDAAAVERVMRQEYKDYPVLYRRLIDARNQAWLPRVEGWLRSRDTWLVVAGAAHMAGRDGLPEALRARGYQVEQL